MVPRCPHVGAGKKDPGQAKEGGVLAQHSGTPVGFLLGWRLLSSLPFTPKQNWQVTHEIFAFSRVGIFSRPFPKGKRPLWRPTLLGLAVVWFGFLAAQLWVLEGLPALTRSSSSCSSTPSRDHCHFLHEEQNVIFLTVSWGYKWLLLERKRLWNTDKAVSFRKGIRDGNMLVHCVPEQHSPCTYLSVK